MTYGGGLLFKGSGSPVIRRNIIHDNDGVFYGGGIMLGYDGDTLAFDVSDNQIYSNTTSENTAAYGGGGLYIAGTVTGTLSRPKITSTFFRKGTIEMAK